MVGKDAMWSLWYGSIQESHYRLCPLATIYLSNIALDLCLDFVRDGIPNHGTSDYVPEPIRLTDAIR